MIKNNRMRRRIPILRISVLRGASYSQLCNIPEIKDLVMETVIDAVAESIQKKKKMATLFEIADSDYYIELGRDQWAMSLEKAIEYFIEKEDYDACACARDLINKIK
jgi:hypothetical protein